MHEAWWRGAVVTPDEAARDAASARQTRLTKPPGSLGRLEALAVRLAALQGRPRPRLERPWISVFAGDHGVVEEGVAAYPQAVTQQMLANFVGGGAAIAVLAREVGAHLEVVDAGSLAAAPIPGVVWGKAGFGTANLARGPAMNAVQLEQALDLGRQAVQRAGAAGADLFLGGEMGIGNSTAAAALACALLGVPGGTLAGPGTGLDAAGVAHKAAVIDRALALHGLLPPPAGEGRGEGAAADGTNGVAAHTALICLGGYEIAALAGAYIACAQSGVPALVDGFIAGSAALAACRLNPGTRDWLLFSHASAEPGHRRVMEALEARPLLDLDLRLGEGSGAALAVPLLRLACALHDGMATFEEAGVSAAA
ncbi:MAG: nicotinate-nucleotide--dimethylbenzimidazole phosphoribosyltransferase [Pseudomonadota bacterium]